MDQQTARNVEGAVGAPDAPHAQDPVLAALLAQPYSVYAPVRQTAPFVFASPHSGRAYPAAFLKQSRLAPLDLRKSEDAFVDELFDFAPELGVPLLIAHFPRAYLDANRAPNEIDPALFAGRESRAGSPARSPRVAAGLGVVPRIVRDGLEIYRGALSPADVEFRLSAFYTPYHAALSALVSETVKQFGTAVVVDCHSMPPPPRRSDIVLGDRYGESAAYELVTAAQRTLGALDFEVTRNAPYAGGYTTCLYGRPREAVHALQIEINRALYLDERTMAKTAGFASVRERIRAFIRTLIAHEALRGGKSGQRRAVGGT